MEPTFVSALHDLPTSKALGLAEAHLFVSGKVYEKVFVDDVFDADEFCVLFLRIVDQALSKRTITIEETGDKS